MTTQFSSSVPSSSFGARSTADEVLAGIDLSGRTALVTGGHSGIGTETSRSLVRAGATVVIGARDPSAAREMFGATEPVQVVQLDLSDLDSVANCGKELLASYGSLDMVINSAGVMACSETRVGRGWELQFATNHLGHFALVNRIRPLLRPGARVVSVSSAGHARSPIRWDDLAFDRGYDKWVAYGQSKTANALFAVHLDRLGRSEGIRSFAVHPGVIATNLSRHMSTEELDALGVTKNGVFQRLPGHKAPTQGAATQVWAATSPMLEGWGGLYLEDCAAAGPWRDEPRGGVKPWAIDREQAARLWHLSAEFTGLDAFV